MHFFRTSCFTLAALLAGCVTPLDPGPAPDAHDPGVRGGAAGAGDAIAGLTAAEQKAFAVGQDDFADTETVKDGLGPTMNFDSCKGCHEAPAIGGSSPQKNPQVEFATKLGATNKLPSFIRADRPVRVARFVRNANGSDDGGVHSLFTIAGRSDAPDCALKQEDFDAEFARGNVILRIPTPTFGAGLIEQIPDAAIIGGQDVERAVKDKMGIRGKPNIVVAFHTISGQPNKNGNDGTIGRFGWKAQNKSLLVFAGEAYNVEMGITNEAFPTEREENAKCQFAPVPNSVTKYDAATLVEGLSSIEKFATFMRFLAAPTPSLDTPGGADSIGRGRAAFTQAGCALCHTESFKTGHSSVAALRDKKVDLFSDLLVHDMGVGLADNVKQGQATGREFRTAPLWGLGKRYYFLHDGRTSDLREAVLAHYSRGSEANEVIRQFYRLPAAQQQDVYNFLRSL